MKSNLKVIDNKKSVTDIANEIKTGVWKSVQEFDIKDFHSAVLDHGIPPLFIVEQKVDEMIERALNT